MVSVVTINGWTNGKSTDQFTTSNARPEAVVEYRNTDGSFGGFCIAHGTNWATYACLNAGGLLDPNAGQPDAMVNPFQQMQIAMGNQNWDYNDSYGQFWVTRQHQVILHDAAPEPSGLLLLGLHNAGSVRELHALERKYTPR